MLCNITNSFLIGGVRVLEIAGLPCQRLYQHIERLVKFSNAFVFQLLRDVIEIDPDISQTLQDPGSELDIFLQARLWLTVSAIRCQSFEWNSVDGLRPNQGFDVLQLTVGWVFSAGARPKQSLNSASVLVQCPEPFASEDFLVNLVRSHSACNRNLAMQLSSEFPLRARLAHDCFQQRVNDDIYPAEEKTRDGRNPFQRLSLLRARFQAGEIGFDNLAISGQAEEQSHIDADSFADELSNGGNPLCGGWHLDKDIWPVERSP